MRTLDRTGWALIAPVHVLMLAVITIPSVYVLWLSLHSSTFGSGLEWVGLDNFREVLSDPYFWRAARNTVLVVNAIVYVEVLLAIGIAVLFMGGLRYPKLMFAIVLMPYAITEVVAVLTWKTLLNPGTGFISRAIEDMGFGLINWSISPPLALGVSALISIWYHLPFTFLLIYAGMVSIPRTVYEAARVDGATAWQQFWRITLPLLVPAILITLIFRLVFAFRLFTEVWLLTFGGPARLTEVVAIYLYQGAFRYGRFGEAAATGWLMVVGSLLIAAIYLWFMHRQMRGARP